MKEEGKAEPCQKKLVFEAKVESSAKEEEKEAPLKEEDELEEGEIPELSLPSPVKLTRTDSGPLFQDDEREEPVAKRMKIEDESEERLKEEGEVSP